MKLFPLLMISLLLLNSGRTEERNYPNVRLVVTYKLLPKKDLEISLPDEHKGVSKGKKLPSFLKWKYINSYEDVDLMRIERDFGKVKGRYLSEAKIVPYQGRTLILWDDESHKVYLTEG